MNFLKLVVAQQGKNQISVVTQKETAEYFGWDKAFPEHRPQWKNPDGSGGWHPCVKWQPDKKFSGGQRLYICRDKSKQGHPQGKTHCFRMHGSFSRKHLVELARVAGDKFEWMEGKYGARIDRADWLALVRD
jgi:hypothetical protein